MKKLLLFAVAAIAFSLTASATAAEAKASGAPVYKYWSPFQLGFFPGVPSYVNNSRVIGLKTGWPISGGKNSRLDGFESSWIYSGTDYVNGLQASIFVNISKEVKGFEPAIAMNINRVSLTGIQASCAFNLAGDVIGIQAGGLNIAKSVVGFQPGVLGCITKEMTGFQAGLFTMAEKMDGFQASPLFNLMGENDGSFQLGLVNVATKGKGVQIGLINVIKGGKVPFIPFFNMSL
jgi:hypothetical protein